MKASGSGDDPRIFVSYSHDDTEEKKKLETHLRLLEQNAAIDTWTDDSIQAGKVWREEIRTVLEKSAAAVLLITPNFLASEFIKSNEIPKILERRNSDGLEVFPVIGRPCAWELFPWLNAMQIRPRDAKPVWRGAGRYVDRELALITLELATVIQQAILKRKLAKENGVENTVLNRDLVAERRDIADLIQTQRNSFASALIRQAPATDERQKQDMESWRTLQATQSAILEIMRDVTQLKSDTVAESSKKWDAVIRSD